jgi:ABC-2 type transport system permease protein
MLRRIGSIVRKEARSYFNSPIAYIVVVFFLAFTAIWLFYISDFAATDLATLRSYFGIMPIVLVLLVPALTMRSWAEESRLGTDELLLTLPFREWELVLGKFIATYGLLLLTLLLTVPVPLTVTRLGDFERGEILGQYFGMALLGGAAVAIGLFVSSVSRNQISAFIINAVILLALTLFNQINSIVTLPAGVAAVINYASLEFHFRSFIRGVLDSRDLSFFVVVTGLFLVLNRYVLVARKWR